MQSDFGNFTEKPPIFYNYEMGSYAQNAPNIDGTNPNPNFAGPLAEFEFEPHENCPTNLIIFDRTNSKNRVMYHPALVEKFGLENYYLNSQNADVDCQSGKIRNSSSSFKEDSNEIDVLLNSNYEEEEVEGFDDDTVSTGRTPENWETVSWNSDSGNSNSGFYDSNYEDKRERTRNLVRVLRGIIPGGEELDTGAVLDESVKYLKYLKMETKKLGVTRFD
ncbi:hypothetical protein LUZ60_000637 [Juncus effusus]|nr:hypothetical protein LUZ60_000637 [Juncus effusus]